MADKTLDVKGLNCPMPVLKAKKALLDVPKGGTLEVLATDAGSIADFEAMCHAMGHELLESGTSEDGFRFLIRRSGA